MECEWSAQLRIPGEIGRFLKSHQKVRRVSGVDNPMFQGQLLALHATITRIEAEVIFGASQFILAELRRRTTLLLIIDFSGSGRLVLERIRNTASTDRHSAIRTSASTNPPARRLPAIIRQV